MKHWALEQLGANVRKLAASQRQLMAHLSQILSS